MAVLDSRDKLIPGSSHASRSTELALKTPPGRIIARRLVRFRTAKDRVLTKIHLGGAPIPAAPKGTSLEPWRGRRETLPVPSLNLPQAGRCGVGYCNRALAPEDYSCVDERP